MVDFNKQLSGGGAGAKPIIPTEIYEKADRESDTGPPSGVQSVTSLSRCTAQPVLVELFSDAKLSTWTESRRRVDLKLAGRVRCHIRGLDVTSNWPPRIPGLKFGRQYVDQGIEYYEDKYRQQQLNWIAKKAATLHMQLVPLPEVAN
jgi:hypothetical protein